LYLYHDSKPRDKTVDPSPFRVKNDLHHGRYGQHGEYKKLSELRELSGEKIFNHKVAQGFTRFLIVIASVSEAIHTLSVSHGLLRRFSPRNDSSLKISAVSR